MPLYWFLLVISALASDSLPARDVPVLRAVMASLGVFVGWALLARLAARSASRQVLSGDVGYGAAAVAFGVQMDLMRWLGLAISTLMLVGFGLAGLLDQLPLIDQSVALRSLLLLSPALLATAWSWFCELRFDAATHPRQIDTRWLQYLINMFRMQAAWLVVPVLVLLTLVDICQFALGIDPASGAMVGGLCALIALPLLLPMILGKIWKLHPIEDPRLADWCQQLLTATRVRGLKILRWETGGSFCTAMVAGFLPGFRRLLLSDALLWRLTPAQTAMVVLHELAHVRRFHLPLRLFVLLPVWLVASGITMLFEHFAYADMIGIAAGLAMSLVTLRWVAYRTELDADAVAVKLAVAISGKVPGVPATAVDAGETLAQALLAVTADQPAARKATWLHPSIDDRCRALRRCAPDIPAEPSLAGENQNWGTDIAPAVTAINQAQRITGKPGTYLPLHVDETEKFQ
ncbi:M48 family metalloprotease [Planctomycetaceae bacterium SH139]